MHQIDRGTAPSIDFFLPFAADRLASAYLTIQQDEKTVIEKTLDDMTVDGNMLSAKLSQEDTLKLSSDLIAIFQLRMKDANGEPYRTEPVRASVGMLLKDGVI